MGETVKTIHLNNCIVRIHIRDSSEAQQMKRMERIKEATARFLGDVEKFKQQSKEKTA